MKSYFSEIVTSKTIKNISEEKTKNVLLVLDTVIKMKVPYPMKSVYHFNIPPNIFQTWHTKDLPPLMKSAVNILKKTNPRFNYQLYDDNDCREFIKNNFDINILNTYDKLIPGAYKADLWRYCILYKYGGIYLDIKYIPVNGFKLLMLLEKEHYCLDIDNNGIYNAILVCYPGNQMLWKAINQIVEHVRNKYYGNSCLDPTGPGLLSRYFSREEKNNFDLKHEYLISCDYRYILFNKYYVFQSYPGYIGEHGQFKKVEHYSSLWGARQIYA